ncbi:sugar kinase [Brucella endophytica]|uniref:Sugar kinase n=1 Tax=Brucella endophytica TaxID=1963359 RepID=A0A916WD97_9HYPH|nr:ROK family transcriptional regulator [Brucella endophytica]GGA88271.1 sugar kinase [Brucella endophytica]
MNDARVIKATSGTNLGGASAHNRRVMVDALRLNGALSRAELARATRLTKQTVSNIIEELERDGLVRSQDAVRKGRGQPATPYELVPEGAYALGLQIDRYVSRCIAVNLVGDVLVRMSAELPAGNPEKGVPIILGLIEKARAALAETATDTEPRLVGLGVAMPGPFGIEGEDDNEWMMARWQNYPLLETLATGTGLEVARQNDAAAAATAEKLVGSAHGLQHAVCLYLGYGLGAGLILNGELYSGSNGNAGEIGMALAPGGAAGLPFVEPLEHQASLASLCNILGIEPSDPELFEKIERAATAPDERVANWMREVSGRLRWMVHLLETVFDPQTIILCGGAPRVLLDRLIDHMQPLLPSLAARRARNMPRIQAGLADPWAVALGAAAEPITRAFDPRFSAILKPRVSP